MLSLLIKPASGMCNMRCKYCFYRDEIDYNKREQGESYSGIMSRKTAENLIKRTFEYSKRSVTFAFQGGEPTLAGVGWFRDFSDMVRKYNVNKINVNMAMQTNGYALDDAFISYLKSEKFLLGLSIDGDGDCHNMHRIDASGKGTHVRIMATGERLKKAGIDVNVLSVMTNASARYVAKTYKYLTSRGYDWVQFISCLPPLMRDELNAKADEMKMFSIAPDRWLKANKILFDLWYADFMAGNRVSVRHLDNYLMMFMGASPESCDMVGKCSVQFVTESDGSVYPCDFYAIEKWKIGDINVDSIDAMAASARAREFISQNRGTLSDEKCVSCKYVKLCRGGCPRLRENAERAYLLCPVIGEFFEYTGERFMKMAQAINRTRE